MGEAAEGSSTLEAAVEKAVEMEALSGVTVHVLFGLVLVVAVLASEPLAKLREWRGGGTEEENKQFGALQRSYLLGLFLFQAGDWLQGPYMYALYDAYGFEHEQIATLFVAGFGSSAVFGTLVGSLTDTLGRKRGALLYVSTYVLSCATKHWNSYWILMVGRILGGIATSLLFSVFDSWLVSEHSRRGLDPSSLSRIFANAQAGNSIVAILSGVIGEWAAQLYPLTRLVSRDGENETTMTADDGSLVVGGYCSPFDAAAVALVLGGVYVAFFWVENYGARGSQTVLAKEHPRSSSNESGLVASLKAGVGLLIRDRRVLFVGLVSACFESAMYAFVFEWTPAVKATPDDAPPYGEIFSVMMLACMAGTRVYCASPSLQYAGFKQGLVSLTSVFVVGALALAVPVFPTLAGQRQPLACLVAFVFFEIVVGVYFPALGTLKSKVIPDALRATIYNLYRIPLNGLVLLILLSHAPGRIIFAASSFLVFLAALFYHRLTLSEAHLADPLSPTQDDKRPLVKAVVKAADGDIIAVSV